MSEISATFGQIMRQPYSQPSSFSQPSGQPSGPPTSSGQQQEEEVWLDICSSVWRHELPASILSALKGKVLSWPDPESQEKFVRLVFSQHHKYPFSTTYARTLLKALVKDVERSGEVIEDSLMEEMLQVSGIS